MWRQLLVRREISVASLMTVPSPSPVAILDVHYEEQSAIAGGIVARGWSDAVPSEERIVRVPKVRPYRPGAFFERELPCLVAVLSALRTPVNAVVIDGNVVLDLQGSPGLGAHLYAHFAGAVVVVGVAKTAYRGSCFAIPVLRGASRRPLFVTALGLEATEAARLVLGMHGSYRLPTLIARVDRIARGITPLAEDRGSSERVRS
jgi:deoxyribonuclease V